MGKMKEMIEKAVQMGSVAKFRVSIGFEIREMNYIELGTYLVTNEQKIDEVNIILKDE